MAANTKRRRSKAERLADYFAGRSSLANEFFSMGNVTEALLKLRNDGDIDEDEVAARANNLIRSHHCLFEELAILKRALQCRAKGEPLVYALLRVRQAFARRGLPRRRR